MKAVNREDFYWKTSYGGHDDYGRPYDNLDYSKGRGGEDFEFKVDPHPIAEEHNIIVDKLCDTIENLMVIIQNNPIPHERELG